MGLTLAPDDVAALEERTEGWIAALQLAALSMRGRDDIAAFIEGFTGDDRLSRLSGSLCDAVTKGRNGTDRPFRLTTSGRSMPLLPCGQAPCWRAHTDDHELRGQQLRMEDSGAVAPPAGLSRYGCSAAALSRSSVVRMVSALRRLRSDEPVMSGDTARMSRPLRSSTLSARRVPPSPLGWKS